MKVANVPGIYRIDGPNGKFYVGSAKGLSRRWISHRYDLRRGGHPNPKLQCAWNAHGESQFVFSVIEFVDDVQQLIAREQYWIDSLDAVNSGYNILLNATSRLGIKTSEETKRKQSLAHTGRKHGPMSEEQKAYFSQLYAGKKVSDETRKKMSDSRKGRIISEEARAKISAAHKGKVYSQETLRKLSEAKLGKRQSPEHIAARMAGMKRSLHKSVEHSAQTT